MSNPLNLHNIMAMAVAAQDFFFSHILVWRTLVQLLVVGLICGLARLAAGAVRPRLVMFLERHLWVEKFFPHVIRVITARLVAPIIAILLLWFAYEITVHFSWPNHGIHIALSLLLAWVIIRLLTSQMRNRTLARFVSLVTWFLAALEIVHLLVPFLTLLNGIGLTIANVRLSVLSLVQGGLLLVVLFWLAKKLSLLFEHWIKTVEHITPSVQVLLHKVITFALFILVVIGVLSALGFSLTALTVFSGAMGLGIGFGLQKIFANLICGLIILADKSIKPGDVIQLGDTYGWINHLGGRYISVVTRDATEHLIPNEELVTNQVVNWSYSNNLVRLKIPIGIAYGSPIPHAMELMLEAAAAAPRVLADPKPVCLLTAFGDSAVEFQLRVWIHDPQNGITNLKSQILLGVWERFQEHGIELPFPQRVLYHKAVPELTVAFRPPG